MKLDEGLAEQKLSLDVTPLIDVVFLLVLFFAISTSFISAKDLGALKDSLVNLAVDKKQLTGRVEGQSTEIEQLGSSLKDLESDYETMVSQKTAELTRLATEVEREKGEKAKLEWMVSALETEQTAIEKTLKRATHDKEALAAQLEQAFRDYQNLEIEIKSYRSAEQSHDEAERLLIAMLKERAAEKATLTTTVQERDQQLAAVENEREKLVRRNTENENARGLLQALIAEKASENEALAARLTTLSASDAQTVAQMELLRNRVQQLRSELAQYRARDDKEAEKERRTARAQATLQTALAEYLKDNDLDIKQDRQRLTLQLSDRILFDSGSANIKAEGLRILRRVGSVLAERIGDLDVQVGGHTDNVPIRASSGPLSSNWGLSSARAVNVVRFFESELKIDPVLLSAVGYSQYRPIDDNANASGRARNRRIEIVLLPR